MLSGLAICSPQTAEKENGNDLIEFLRMECPDVARSLVFRFVEESLPRVNEARPWRRRGDRRGHAGGASADERPSRGGRASRPGARHSTDAVSDCRVPIASVESGTSRHPVVTRET